MRLSIEYTEGRTVPELFFEPVGLYIQPGDTVEFVAVTPHHSVTAYHPQHGKPQRVPDGVGPFTSPILVIGETWRYTFTVPGVYDIWCGPHEVYGMAMRIVVGEPTGPATKPSTDFGPLGTFGTAGLVLNSPLLAPQNIMAHGAVSWRELPAEVKAVPDLGAAH